MKISLILISVIFFGLSFSFGTNIILDGDRTSGLFCFYNYTPTYFGRLDPIKGTFKQIASFQGLFVPSTGYRVTNFDAKGNKFYAALSNNDGTSYLTSITTTGQTSSIRINTTCSIWELSFDNVRRVFYGTVVDSPEAASVYLITFAGKAEKVGFFPLRPNQIRSSYRDGCYNVFGGGTIYDEVSQSLYYHYNTNSGMFMAKMDVTTGSIVWTSSIPHTLVSPVFSSDFKSVYSLEVQNFYPYHKWLSVLDVSTGNILAYGEIPYYSFNNNEATLKIKSDGTGTYYTLLAGSTTNTNNLVGLDIKTGKIVSSPAIPNQDSIWDILYVN